MSPPDEGNLVGSYLENRIKKTNREAFKKLNAIVYQRQKKLKIRNDSCEMLITSIQKLEALNKYKFLFIIIFS